MIGEIRIRFAPFCASGTKESGEGKIGDGGKPLDMQESICEGDWRRLACMRHSDKRNDVVIKAPIIWKAPRESGMYYPAAEADATVLTWHDAQCGMRPFGSIGCLVFGIDNNNGLE